MSMRVEASVGRSIVEASPEGPSHAEAKDRSSAKPVIEGDQSFQRAVKSLGREIDKGETLMQRALSGGSQFSASDLIALQAGIYRYSEAVDLAAKFVDRAASTIRTTLQGSG